MRKFSLLPALCQILICFIYSVSCQSQSTSEDWISLFNGENLDGWTVKIAGHPMGDNAHQTFHVEDGIMKVAYDDYDKFDMQVGHIFTNITYSHYILRLDYLFLGSGMPDAPDWTNLNSGVMIHSQSPQSMLVDQGFPVSIEGQFLAEGATAGTQTANVVSPGTHIELEGVLNKDHINDSDSELFPLETWVTFEAEVHGGELIIYRVNGKEVMRFSRPQLDDADPDAKRLLAAGAAKFLDHGFIALQAEGQPVWFRNIRIRILEEN